jgi:NADPH:quinone reductase-like Zn-dependent oxidoreductase
MIRRGQYPDVKEKPPFSPGYDMIGLVDKLGEGVTKFKIGQKVADLTVIGAYSEYICLPESQLTIVPDENDGVEAAFDPIGGKNFKRSFKTLKSGGKLVAYGFYNASTGKGGSILFDFFRIQLMKIIPNGRSVSFYSICSLRKKHPDWFSKDLTKLFALLSQNKIRPVIIHPTRRNLKNSPSCPKCGDVMHCYMREAEYVRFRCSNYPECKSYFKIGKENIDDE